MGYRTYIGTIPKKEYNKIKSLTEHQLYDFYKESKDLHDSTPDNFYIGVYDFGKPLYEFGKYTDFNPPKKSLKSFFKNKELKEKYEDYEFHIVTKEFLEYIIEGYKERVKTYYNNMVLPLLGNEESGNKGEFLKSVKTHYEIGDNTYEFDFSKITPEEQTALYKVIEHVRSMRIEWVHLTPYDLNQEGTVTDSWKYEYAIFELVKIYKSFDWKKNQMIYYGY